MDSTKDRVEGTRATVIEIIGRTGSRGGITQVKVQLVGQQRTLIRNVMGPVRKGDTLELMECEREARRLR
ncbi:unnamed protein product (macronuclear) [Paramecium tetraurelia]|uniref:Chromosome undetermined scaffold_11, whole genome shotgun sequence n=2 Tax=Paramecium TaxID=5884 RepID=A0BII3_PARTE|nr:uncharacterized protein GSPATT00004722001 [Paramecium tetraurelia]XP_001427597.1 uncharacterized protein GSPATT00030838001 [Paramecium tetraurelia]XP_001454584.1 uncharacterized protein GSPATT00020840001 [Paramecium tetraurelia]XP_001455462.1 uncharacterized protein GSPATT00003033001 [Paramecium tetraurelia]XP_001460265.1 uncharacterized protein GSPATT00025604001 [Paramecium tetraurelia]CAD8137493.1 unnamed protein product [Paramecium octaurelia]CAD8144811.1 unnamed protein product [Parame|eukprot:XP_001425748.1 hypothetical protein (macronuclear) [Paramecium tetraurelia strain d4-2]